MCIPVTGREVSSLLLSTRTLYLNAAAPPSPPSAAGESQLPLTAPGAAPAPSAAAAAASFAPLAAPSSNVAVPGPAYFTPAPSLPAPLLPSCHVLVLWYDYLFVHFRMH